MNLRTLVPALAIAVVYPSGVPASEPAGSKCRLDVGSKLLDDALQEVSRQCSVQLLYFSDITAGKAARKLQGEYAIGEALGLLLENTGLTFRSVNATTVEITPSNAAVKRSVGSPRETPHRDSANESGLQEVVIHGTVKDLVATRTETPLREIPQSIAIVSSEQMRQQGNLNFLDAMQDAVGISFERRDPYFRYLYSRGFNLSSYTLDGGGGLRVSAQTPAAPFLLLTPDLGEFDRVEVLRGSNALFGADASPGGAINLIRKRPLQDAAILFSSTAGSWNNYRQELDVTGPLALDGALRGRMVVSNASREFFYKGADDRRQSVFGVLDYELTEDTLVTLGGSYLKSRARPFEVGMLLLSDTSDPKLPRDAAITFDWSRFDTRVAEGFFRLEHGFSGESRLRLNATLLDNSVTYFFGYLGQPINVVTRKVPNGGSQYTLEPFGQKQLNLEATFTGAGEWWGHRVEWVLGGDLVRASSSTHTAQQAFRPAIDPYNFDPALYPYPIRNVTPLPLSTRNDVDIRIGGVFASLRAQITAPWSVTAGLRVSSQSVTDSLIYFWSGVGHPIYDDFEDENVITPYVGTLYTLNSTWSLYASYADIFRNNDGAMRSDLSVLSPMHGVTLEAGIKGVWADGALNGSLAVYKIAQRDVAVRQSSTGPVPQCCYLPSGRNEAEGVDLELSGQLTREWLVGGGYTFNQNTLIRPGTAPAPFNNPTPRHLLKMWTDYRLPGGLYRWTLGGTLHAQSTVAPRGQLARQKSYAVLNPRVSYRFDEHWQAALTVNNVFDKWYYEDVTGALWYGEPRNYFFRLDARF